MKGISNNKQNQDSIIIIIYMLSSNKYGKCKQRKNNHMYFLNIFHLINDYTHVKQNLSNCYYNNEYENF